MIHLPPDFREFLKLLNGHGVEYLLIGGRERGRGRFFWLALSAGGMVASVVGPSRRSGGGHKLVD